MDLNDNEQNKSDKEKFLLNIEEVKSTTSSTSSKSLRREI